MAPSLLQSDTPTRLRLRPLLALLLLAVVSCASIPTALKRPGVFRVVHTDGEFMWQGTGFLKPGGCSEIITAAHVFQKEGTTAIVVDDKAVPAKLVKKGDGIGEDVALVMPEPVEGTWPDLCKDGFSPYRWGKDVEVGEQLWVHGWAAKFNILLVVPATAMSTVLPMSDGTTFIIVSAPALMPGQSGAPLMNAKGEVVGLMKMSVNTDKGPTHFEVAVPSSVIRKVLDL